MTKEQQEHYERMYKDLGLDPQEFADLDAQGRQAKVREHLNKEFCREMFGTECTPDCSC